MARAGTDTFAPSMRLSHYPPATVYRFAEAIARLDTHTTCKKWVGIAPLPLWPRGTGVARCEAPKLGGFGAPG